MNAYTITHIPESKDGEIKTVKVDFEKGISIEILNYGATIKSLEVPDKNGLRENIVLNYPTIEGYLEDQAYIGCVVGRYANRIANGKFELNGQSFEVAQNHGEHHLHGGDSGFNKKVWEIRSVEELDDEVVISLRYVSEDGEEGYPGTLTADVQYKIQAHAVKVCYTAETTQDTVFNTTNHTYFNLSGNAGTLIDEHLLTIDADSLVVTNDFGIPNGEYQKVAATPYDFSEEKKIGSDAFDDCYVVQGDIMLKEMRSGRSIKMETSFPGVQLYTADYLSDFGMLNRSGVCLETQFYPDAPNHPHFPSTILKKGDTFSHHTLYTFEAK